MKKLLVFLIFLSVSAYSYHSDFYSGIENNNKVFS